MESSAILGLKAKRMPIPRCLRTHLRMSEVVDNFFRAVVVQIRDPRNTVAFKTPRVAKKPPWFEVHEPTLEQFLVNSMT